MARAAPCNGIQGAFPPRGDIVRFREARAGLELDVNYMLWPPLRGPVHANAKSVGTLSTPKLPVLDIHEVAAGKLAALLARRARSNQLVSTLRPEALGDATEPIPWERSLNDECRDALRAVLPLRDAELELPHRLLDHGEILAALLATAPALCERISVQPMLAWKSLHFGMHRVEK